MKIPLATISMVMVLAAGTASAAPNFPATRNTVGTGEYYLLDEFGDWKVDCLRDKKTRIPAKYTRR